MYLVPISWAACKAAVISVEVRVLFKSNMSFQDSSKTCVSAFKMSIYVSGSFENLSRSSLCLGSYKGGVCLSGSPWGHLKWQERRKHLRRRIRDLDKLWVLGVRKAEKFFSPVLRAAVPARGLWQPQKSLLWGQPRVRGHYNTPYMSLGSLLKQRRPAHKECWSIHLSFYKTILIVRLHWKEYLPWDPEVIFLHPPVYIQARLECRQ